MDALLLASRAWPLGTPEINGSTKVWQLGLLGLFPPVSLAAGSVPLYCGSAVTGDPVVGIGTQVECPCPRWDAPLTMFA